MRRLGLGWKGRLAVLAAASALGLIGTVGTALEANAGLVPTADLSLIQTGTPDPVGPGGKLTYTISVTNAGPDSASAVVVTDVVPGSTTIVSLTAPAGWTCVSPASGGTGTVTCSCITLQALAAPQVFTLVVKVNPGTSEGTTITNTAAVTSATIDANPANNSATLTTLVKTPLADLFLTKADDPDPVIAGKDLTYTLSIANAGPNGAQDVWVSDQIPANTTFVSLGQTNGPAFSCSVPPVGGGGTVSCSNATFGSGATATFRLVVNVNTTDGTLIRNTFTVGSSTSDPNPGNNSDTETTQVKTEADLSVTKADAPDPVAAGDNLTYTITLANPGPNDAQNVSVSDPIPANTSFVSLAQNGGPAFTCSTPAVGGTGTVTCSIATLVSGATASFALVVKVNVNTPDGTVLSNTVTVTSTTTDPVPGNNSDTETTKVNAAPAPSADLSATKADDVDPVAAGANLTYTLTISNAGPSSAQTVSLSDTLPANTTFVSLAQNSGPIFTCSTPSGGGTGTVTCSTATLTAGTSAAFSLVVNVNANTPDGTVLSNTVTVTSSTADPVPGNNSATETTQVQSVPGG